MKNFNKRYFMISAGLLLIMIIGLTADLLINGNRKAIDIENVIYSIICINFVVSFIVLLGKEIVDLIKENWN